MRLRAVWGLLVVAACEAIPPTPAPRCRVPDASGPLPAPATICAHLERIQCSIPDCSVAYERFRAVTSSEEFQRLVQCYTAARTCDEADQCAYACGADGGMVSLRPRSDAAVDSPRVDATVDTLDAATADGQVVDMDVVADTPGEPSPQPDPPDALPTD